MRLLRSLLRYKVATLSLALMTLGACTDDLREPSTQKPTEAYSISPLAAELGKGNMALDFDVEPMQGQNEARTSYYMEYRQVRRGDTPPSTQGYNYDDEYTSTLTMHKDEEIGGVLIFIRQKNSASDKPLIIRKLVTFKVIDAPDHTNQYDTSKKSRVRWVGNVDFPSDYTLTKEYNLPTSTELTGDDRVENLPTKLGQWYVMAMLDYTTGSVFETGEADPAKAEDRGTNKIYYNRRRLGGDNLPHFVTEQSATWSYPLRNGIKPLSLSIPYISQWRQVKIVQLPVGGHPTDKSYTGFVNDLHFKPQGVILQFDLGVASFDVQEVRRYGLLTNQLDFKGYYDLEVTDLYERFKNRNPSTGIGIPKWVPDAPSASGFKLYYPSNSETELSSGERLSPWDMPTLSDDKTPTWGGDESTKLSTADAAVTLNYPTTALRKNYPYDAVGGITTPEGITNAWFFHAIGGHFPSRTRTAVTVNPHSRCIFTFWGMPRANASTNRYTYFFASAYQSNYKDDIYDAQSTWDPKERITENRQKTVLGRISLHENEEAIKKHEKLVKENEEFIVKIEKLVKDNPDANNEPGKTYKHQLDSARAKQSKLQDQKSGLQAQNSNLRAQYPESLFTTYTADSTKFYDTEQPAFIKQQTPRTQPLIVLYQSNKKFEERKVYHAQAALAPDLILTDVIYQTHGGQNYSALEIYNPSCLWADLSQYAIARLIDNGTHMSFRKADGTPTDNIKEAQILPLSLVAPNEHSPYNRDVATLKSAFPDPHTSDGYWGRNNLRRRVLMGDLGVKRIADGWVENVSIDVYSRQLKSNNYTTRWMDGGTLISNHFPTPRPTDKENGSINKAFLLAGQSMLLGASGYIHNPPVDDNSHIRPGGEWFHTVWYPAIYGEHTENGFIRHFIAYADGPKVSEGWLEDDPWLTQRLGYNIPGLKKFSKYKEGTLDMKIGDGFVLLKMNPLGGWQIIDATAPVGPHHEAFPGTYAAYKAHYTPLKTSKPESYSQQRMEGVNYPFIPPFRTKQVTAHKYSDWSDSWRTTTTPSEYTIGYYIKEPQKVTGITDWGAWNLDPFNPVRTIFDKDFKTKWWPSYRALRPIRR